MTKIDLKTKLVYALTLFIVLLSSISIANLSKQIVYAAAIPDGCPGSSAPATPPPSTCASIPPGCPGSTAMGPPAPGQVCPYDTTSTERALSDSLNGNESCTLNKGESGDSCTLFKNYLFPAIDFLAAGVGLIVTIMIVMGGIQYSSARGDPNATAQAKKRISNALLALVTFGLFWTFLQWIVPGGIL